MKRTIKPSPSSKPERDGIVPSHLNFPVVGIGASAGGLAALKVFFEHMPANSDMAFVIVLHLSPDHESVADKILQASTAMPVIQVTGTSRIEPNHVYVISPASQLAMNDGYLKVVPSTRPLGKHIAIDLFFRDLADVHKEYSFCLVLSGTGSDGAVGLSRIKEQGASPSCRARTMPSSTACRWRQSPPAWSMRCCRWQKTAQTAGIVA